MGSSATVSTQTKPIPQTKTAQATKTSEDEKKAEERVLIGSDTVCIALVLAPPIWSGNIRDRFAPNLPLRSAAAVVAFTWKRCYTAATMLATRGVRLLSKFAQRAGKFW